MQGRLIFLHVWIYLCHHHTWLTIRLSIEFCVPNNVPLCILWTCFHHLLLSQAQLEVWHHVEGGRGPGSALLQMETFSPCTSAFSCVLAAPRTFTDLQRVSAEPLGDSLRQSVCISLVSHLQVLEFVALSTGLSHYRLWWLSRYLLKSLTSWCHRPH